MVKIVSFFSRRQKYGEIPERERDKNICGNHKHTDTRNSDREETGFLCLFENYNRLLISFASDRGKQVVKNINFLLKKFGCVSGFCPGSFSRRVVAIGFSILIETNCL